MSDAIPIPPRPNLEHYKKQAKDLLKACQASDPAAIRAWTNQWSKLWPDTGPIERRLRETDIKRLADAQFFLARAHNFESWPKFAKHIQSLQRAGSPDAAFETAADAIASGDMGTLRRMLDENPELIRRRSSRTERSTLLHYVSANGIEDFRQKTPANIVEIATLLLDAGADVNAESDAYAGHSTTLGLVATSAHPRGAGLQIPLLELLLERGASIDEGVVHACLANGCPEAAEFLAARGAELDLDGAAGLGRLDVVQRLLPRATKEEREAALRLASGYGRHDVVKFLLESGVDPTAANRDGMTALHWAANAADIDIVKLLLARNVPLEVRNIYGGTVLGQAVWAALNDPRPNHLKVIEMLIAAGAKAGEDWFTGRPEIDAALQRGRADAPPLTGEAARAVDLIREASRARREGHRDDAMRIAAEAIALLRRVDEPLRLAHTIRHLADMNQEAAQPQLAEPLYDEAIAIYRRHPETPPLDLANAIRGLAELKDEEHLWQEAHDLYVATNVPPGVAETARRLARLAQRRKQ
jgi:hypothetical protein